MESKIRKPNTIIKYIKHIAKDNTCVIDTRLKWVCKHDNKRKLLVDVGFDSQFIHCYNDKNIRLIVIYLSLKQKYDCGNALNEKKLTGHANILIYDKKTKTLERFDPHGAETYDAQWYQQDKLDDVVPRFISALALVSHYYKPIDYCPISIQRLQQSDIGYCTIWAVYYVRLRISNPDAPRDIIIQNAINALSEHKAFDMIVNAIIQDIIKYI